MVMVVMRMGSWDNYAQGCPRTYPLLPPFTLCYPPFPLYLLSQAVPLSQDHKPDRQDEKNRIMRRGVVRIYEGLYGATGVH